MLQRHLLGRAGLISQCACRSTTHAVGIPRCSSAVRTLASSSSRSKPAAAQVAEVDPDFEPAYFHSPARAFSPSLLSPSSGTLGSGQNHRLPVLQLPSPLPSDITAPPADPRSALYPTTGVIDSVSMISICLRRPEHVPRAYQIFRQLLEDARKGLRRLPEAELWGKVTEGVARLGRDSPQDPVKSVMWRRRAQDLVDRWETEQKTRGLNVIAGEGEGGMKVYQGWFAGTVSSNTSIDALSPYFANGSVDVNRLLDGIRPSDMPLAYESLLQLARRDQLEDLERAVEAHQGVEKERRDVLAREVVEEVKPVLDTAGRNILRRPNRSDQDVSADSAVATVGDVRFAVANLRSTLSHVAKPYLPRERQMSLERASYDAAAAELQRSHDMLNKRDKGKSDGTALQDDVALQRQRLQSWMFEWLGGLKLKLAEDIQAMKEGLEVTASAEAAKAEAVERADLRAANEVRSGRIPAKPKAESVPTFTSGPSGMKDDVLALYLTLLPVDKLALIAIIELMRQAGGHGGADGMKALRAMLAVGKAVETEYRAETIKNVAGVDSPHWLRTLDPQTQKPTRMLVGNVWQKLGKQLKEGQERGEALGKQMEDDLRAVWTPAWSQMTHLGVGSYLVKTLLGVAKVTRTAVDRQTGEKLSEEQPAFSHGYDYLRGKKLGVIRLNPVVASRLSKDTVGVMIHPKHLPMLVEPRPWRSPDEGGYLIHRVSVMRYKDSSEQRSYLQAASAEKHMEAVFHGLDVLSATPWAINRQVFDVVLQAWNEGDAIADIPASEEKATYDLPAKDDSGDPAQRSIYVEKAKVALAQSKKDHNERCKFNYNIEIARAYLNETFYLPHSMDFRGRAYPIPPHLSPVGDDLCRGLLRFGIKKPLGKTGLKWLQIQLANVYGFDKASFDERARFAQDHEADIFDSADNPLDGKRWWLKAEDPWQCLATCFDLAAALRSPDPEAYESSLPVHQDGTCNGMQHYAALGGDVAGARAVNLENGDRPADIYTGVADVVNKVIEQDRAEGHPIAQLITGGPLGRKVVKQTVMTTVYGVTFIGARDQIARQLQARGDIPPEQIFVVSGYIAKTVLGCIGDIFSGAKDIMDWLTTAARLVARSIPSERVDQAVLQLKPQPGQRPQPGRTPQSKLRLEKELMTSVVWTSPLGLPVVQPYRKAAKKQVMTALQSVYISDPNAPSEVSPQKQATAFPPNFIHSLDATHMLLTATKCKQANITFASVHDSYWTHASSVELMSEQIREMFINLHSRDLVGQLRTEFLDRYGEHRIPVKSARAISTAAATRRTKDAARRKQLAALLGEDADSPIVTAAVEGEHSDVASALSEDADDADEVMAGVASEAEVGDEGMSEDDTDTPTPIATAKVANSPGLELTNADLAALRATRADAVPEEQHGQQRFVRFRDVLPPTPPRGAFDVSRIKDSAYFFS